MKTPEIEEAKHLEYFQTRLRHALKDIEMRLNEYAQDIQAQKSYLWESRADMDHIEKVSTRQSIQQAVMMGETLHAQKKRLLRIARSPYFGRFDFVRKGDDQPEAVYVGVHHFRDEQKKMNLVYDWRAPISSMFYDHEIGPVYYESPSGEIHGEMLLKRQFRIRDGQMEFMLESSVNIMDDVLQKELSQASDDRIKNIVATIQRDQNAIIRNEDAHVLIIQGVAGSGKTSIALHRIAFLLYRFKDSLSSEDILIISPNRVFADYISNVLPELGEESVSEIGMEMLADELLDYKYRFQTFFEQTALLLEKNDEGMQRRITFKSSAAFLYQLDAYAQHLEQSNFVAEDIRIGRRLIPAWFIGETYHKHRGISRTERISRVVKAIEQNVGIYYNYDITTMERAALREAVHKMVRQSTLRETYKNLFEWLGQPDLFKQAKGGRLEYADVFPLIYLKLRLEGINNPYKRIKHLLIDEMQDYTPVQYAVIARLFLCRKTILGDTNQSVNPYSASKVEEIQRAFMQATCVKLTKSYRSTFEIMQFVQTILPNPELVVIKRHGQVPEIHKCKNKAEENEFLLKLTDNFLGSHRNSLGVICKTQKQAKKLYEMLHMTRSNVRLLDAQSASFSGGVIICTAHMAKGLEFDQVVIPDASDKTYHTEMDRNMLYVACTRAMHQLIVTYVGELTRFIPAQCVA